MALDSRRRAKQLAKKAAAAKARAREKKHGSSHGSPYRLDLIRQTAKYPVYECYMRRGLLEEGFGTVLISRKMGAMVASGVFLIDSFCLGVKSCFPRIQPEVAYWAMLESMQDREDLIGTDAACARKLVEGAVAFARDLGFEPDEDYGAARLIFGDIDPAACPQTYTFGKDGKPLFISGPYDTAERIKKIMNTLARRCGPDGYHFIINANPYDSDNDE